MAKYKEIGLFIAGLGIGTYVGQIFSGPLAGLNPFIGVILIVAGAALLFTGR